MFGLNKSWLSPRHTRGLSDLPSHTKGTVKGEETVLKKGREKGRNEEEPHRVARDATSIRPAARDPIDPKMPHIPPA